MKKPSQPLPIPTLNRVEHIADRRYLLRHSPSRLPTERIFAGERSESEEETAPIRVTTFEEMHRFA